MHSMSVGITPNGYRMNFRTHCHCFTCNPYLSKRLKVSTGFAKIKGIRVDSEGWYSCLEVRKVRTKRMSMISKSEMISVLQTAPCSIASTEYDLCEEKEEVYGSSIEHKVPPFGSLKIQRNLINQNGNEYKPSLVCNTVVNKVEDRIPFLEERDEVELSRRILKLSRLNKVNSALKLFKSMEISGLQPDLHACNSLLSCLLRSGMLDDALKFFYFMNTKEMASGHTCSLILKGVANSVGCDAALSMFEELERNNSVSKSFDVVVYNTMISIFSKENSWIQIENIWRRLQEKAYPGTKVTYRLLVCTFVRCRQYELAFDAYHEMIQNELLPCDDVMHAIIGACTKEGKWDLALTVFQNMLDSGVKPNMIACNAVINTLGKSGKVKLAFKVYDLMKSLGHSPDAYTWNALLGALNNANQYADALQLFDSIKRDQSSVLNLHIYSTVLMSCQKLGLWQRALQLLWEMEASELCLSAAHYNLVIGACEVARQPKVGLQIYDHMVHQKHSPDIFTLLSLIRSCIWGSLWTEVEEILNRYPPNGSMYNAAIQGLFLRGNIDLAMKLYEKMNEWNLKPDGKTRALLLQKLRKNTRKRR